MGLQFYLGRTGTGKTSRMIEEIKNELKSDPLGNPIVYITPEQMSFQAENEQVTIHPEHEILNENSSEDNRESDTFSGSEFISEILSGPNMHGTVRAQVYSFTRLSWLVLGETGGMSRERINKTGTSMLLRRILDENKDELLIFKNASNKQGFIEKLESMLVEYKRYAVDSETMISLSEQSNSPILKDKLKDFALINSKLNETVDGHALDNEAYLKFLADKIPQSEYLKSAKIYIDGFHGFTQLEENIIEKLIQVSQDVVVSLTLDKPYKNVLPENENLFRMTGETYNRIFSLAKSNAVEIKSDVILENNERARTVNSLKHFERHFESRPSTEYTGEDNGMKIVEAKNKRVEIEYISREILKCVRKGYRFRDIIVLNRNSEGYSDIIENTFRDYNIPTFIDQKKPMIHHPVIELINGSLDAILTNFTHEGTFRAFKTEMFFQDSKMNKNRDELSILENYVLERGIRGSKWLGQWEYRFDRGLGTEIGDQSEEEKAIEVTINSQKAIHFEPLLKLSKVLNCETTVRGYATSLFEFVQELKVDEKLQSLIEQATETGKVQLAREHEQAWSGLIELLDQAVNVFGNQKMSLKDFASIMKSGAESLNFSMTPPAIDQVIVGNLELSKPLHTKIVFVIGMNDGVLPMKISEGGILTESERESLAGMGVRLASFGLTKLYDEEFVAYMALNLAEHRTYFTYPIADDEGKTLLPSSYVKRIENMLPSVKAEKTMASDDMEFLSDIETLDFITNSKQTVKFLISELRRKVAAGEKISSTWIAVLNALNKNHDLSKSLEFALKSLDFSNASQDMSKESVATLYGNEIVGSVSKIETYNKCPFSYFANYGLKLKPRSIYELEASHIGTLFHESINMIDKRLIASNISWSALNKNQCKQLAADAVSELAPKLQSEILLSNSRMNYIKGKLTSIVEKSALAMKMHAEKSSFKTLGHEIPFGYKDGEIPMVEIALENSSKIKLRGRIDRVDFLQDGEKTYFSVIDYKSSKKDIDFGEIYDGTSLQMFTYLNVLQNNAEKIFTTEASPAGLTYFHLKNPLLKKLGDIGEVAIEAEWMKEYKLKGLLVDDIEILKKMDSTLGSCGESDIIPVKIKKNGEFYSSAKVASEETFSLISEHVKKVYEKSGNEILSGKTTIHPYKKGNTSGCDYCDYKPICSFDARDIGNQYRIGKSLKINELLAEITPKGVDYNE